MDNMDNFEGIFIRHLSPIDAYEYGKYRAENINLVNRKKIRNDVIDEVLRTLNGIDCGIRCAMCTNANKSDRGCDGGCIVDDTMLKKVMDVVENFTKSIEQLKEHKNSKYCEWIEYDYRTMCPKDHDVDNPYWRIPISADKIKYCPYCGKEIHFSKEQKNE